MTGCRCERKDFDDEDSGVSVLYFRILEKQNVAASAAGMRRQLLHYSIGCPQQQQQQSVAAGTGKRPVDIRNDKANLKVFRVR